MKELQNHQPDNTTGIVKQVQKTKYIDTLSPYPGQKLWELNPATGEIKEVPMKDTSVDFVSNSVTHQVVTKDGCKYVLAINKKNAQRRFFKDLAGE